MGQATKSEMARVRVGNGLGVGVGESINGAVFEELEGGGLGEMSGMLISRSRA